jgi:peptidyl-prolyl cis-trans isomerase SurA
MKRTIAPLAAVLLATSSLGAQDLIDRIAAVVNNEIILLSEVEEKIFIAQAQGQLAGVDSTEIQGIRKQVLERLIEERLVVQRAESQGIRVETSEVMTKVDEAMESVRKRFPTDAAFKEALGAEGITETMLRERYETDIRQELMGQRIVAREVRSKVAITPADVEAYYEKNKAEIPPRPDEVHLAHVLAAPITPDREEAAQKRVAEARRRILAGEAFADVAREVSEDPTRTRGGLLGRFGPGDLDPDFEAVVDTIPLNTLSVPTRTGFGYHVIEVLSREGAEFEVRHIVVLVEPLPEDVEKALDRAESARARALAGEPFAALAAELSDDTLTREQGGDLGWSLLGNFIPNIAQAVDSLEVGELSQVVRGPRGFHVFKLLERKQGGAYTYEEIQDRLFAYVEQEKLQVEYDKWIAAVRETTYVEVKAW